MARHGVKREDVFLACEQLIEKGTAITVANVRNELGTGSYGTLLPIIREFNAREDAAGSGGAKPPPPLPGTPEALSELGSQLVSELWTQAATTAQARITEIEVAYAKELELVKAELAARTTELEQAHADLTRLEEEFAQTKQKLDETETRAGRLDTEVTLLRSQAKEKDDEARRNLERAVTAERAVEARAEEIKQLYADLKASRQAIDQAQNALLEAQKANAQKDGELASLRALTKDKSEESKRHLERAASAEKELELLRAKQDAEEKRANSETRGRKD